VLWEKGSEILKKGDIQDNEAKTVKRSFDEGVSRKQGKGDSGLKTTSRRRWKASSVIKYCGKRKGRSGKQSIGGKKRNGN